MSETMTVMPRDDRTRVPLYRHPGPCSPPSWFTGAAKATPSLADLLRRDQLRVDHIHWRLSESEGVGQQQQQSPPGVVQTAVLDTASDVPWVQCAPCPVPPCHPQADSTYDPARSSTYDALGRLYGGGCANGQCRYRVPFPNSNLSSSSGTYGTHLLAVGPNSGITFKFGCSHAEAGQGGSSDSDNTTAGVMALGGGPESLVSQAAANYGDAFSYCIPAATERQPAGFFVLGAPPSADSSAYVATPMLRYPRVPTFYLVRLQGIAVNGQLLNVTPSVFAAGTVLDSRTAVTRLPPTAYRALREAFRGWMAVYTAAPPRGSLDTCYDFSGAFFVAPPRVELVLERGNVLELDRSGVLFHDCLAFAPNSDDRMPGILGNVQQQTMEVLYDVGGGAVGFRRGAC
ncbi:hypothetical protein C2845_PM10G00340 [Panicum miliaceum]|uniref:Peptidase A1 domain-containing protein n=1 Tax=Panicum miliaceum TaxID=4540 RepID=A0A3L6PDS6_PANMI|nr:hypothetical protein C2845_PM10G00340 [Panicum miliaceum]